MRRLLEGDTYLRLLKLIRESMVQDLLKGGVYQKKYGMLIYCKHRNFFIMFYNNIFPVYSSDFHFLKIFRKLEEATTRCHCSVAIHSSKRS